MGFFYTNRSKIDHNKPDILLLDTEKKTCFIIDVACPFDTRIGTSINYSDFSYAILKCWKGKVKKVLIIPIIIIGALGLVTNNLKSNLEWNRSTTKGIPVGNSKNIKKSTRLLREMEIHL